ncbi:hypothetical protein HKX48_007182 [Thoreauomyces humboldtii]|nr:hypothetical protein HKX48_007182 [Thoreauomyces humboldtii]
MEEGLMRLLDLPDGRGSRDDLGSEGVRDWSPENEEDTQATQLVDDLLVSGSDGVTNRDQGIAISDLPSEASVQSVRNETSVLLSATIPDEPHSNASPARNSAERVVQALKEQLSTVQPKRSLPKFMSDTEDEDERGTLKHQGPIMLAQTTADLMSEDDAEAPDGQGAVKDLADLMSEDENHDVDSDGNAFEDEDEVDGSGTEDVQQGTKETAMSREEVVNLKQHAQQLLRRAIYEPRVKGGGLVNMKQFLSERMKGKSLTSERNESAAENDSPRKPSVSAIPQLTVHESTRGLTPSELNDPAKVHGKKMVTTWSKSLKPFEPSRQLKETLKPDVRIPYQTDEDRHAGNWKSVVAPTSKSVSSLDDGDDVEIVVCEMELPSNAPFWMTQKAAVNRTTELNDELIERNHIQMKLRRKQELQYIREAKEKRVQDRRKQQETPVEMSETPVEESGKSTADQQHAPPMQTETGTRPSSRLPSLADTEDEDGEHIVLTSVRVKDRPEVEEDDIFADDESETPDTIMSTAPIRLNYSYTIDPDEEPGLEPPPPEPSVQESDPRARNISSAVRPYKIFAKESAAPAEIDMDTLGELSGGFGTAENTSQIYDLPASAALGSIRSDVAQKAAASSETQPNSNGMRIVPLSTPSEIGSQIINQLSGNFSSAPELPVMEEAPARSSVRAIPISSTHRIGDDVLDMLTGSFASPPQGEALLGSLLAEVSESTTQAAVQPSRNTIGKPKKPLPDDYGIDEWGFGELLNSASESEDQDEDVSRPKVRKGARFADSDVEKSGSPRRWGRTVVRIVPPTVIDDSQDEHGSVDSSDLEDDIEQFPNGTTRPASESGQNSQEGTKEDGAQSIAWTLPQALQPQAPRKTNDFVDEEAAESDDEFFGEGGADGDFNDENAMAADLADLVVSDAELDGPTGRARVDELHRKQEKQADDDAIKKLIDDVMTGNLMKRKAKKNRGSRSGYLVDSDEEDEMILYRIGNRVGLRRRDEPTEHETQLLALAANPKTAAFAKACDEVDTSQEGYLTHSDSDDGGKKIKGDFSFRPMTGDKLAVYQQRVKELKASGVLASAMAKKLPQPPKLGRASTLPTSSAGFTREQSVLIEEEAEPDKRSTSLWGVPALGRVPTEVEIGGMELLKGMTANKRARIAAEKAEAAAMFQDIGKRGSFAASKEVDRILAKRALQPETQLGGGDDPPQKKQKAPHRSTSAMSGLGLYTSASASSGSRGLGFQIGPGLKKQESSLEPALQRQASVASSKSNSQQQDLPPRSAPSPPKKRRRRTEDDDGPKPSKLLSFLRSNSGFQK